MDGTYSQRERPIPPSDAIHPVRPEADADDTALLEACRSGDSSAYGELVRRYQDRVFNLCFRMSGNRDDAEDFAQEAFVKALRSLDRFAERSRFYTWVFRIAVNLIISARRKHGRRSTLSLDGGSREKESSVALGSLLSSAEATPERKAMEAEQNLQVLQALAMLDEEQRSILVLRDMESLSYEEIADILDVPTGTVKSRLHRARLALRDLLGPLLGMD